MGLLSRRLGVQALSLEDPAQPLMPPGALFESLGLGRSDAGVLMNEHQAMRITTAQSCVRIISEDLATNAHEIFQEMPNGAEQLAKDHRYWGLLHDEPNPNMSAAVFWGALGANACGWGNGYAWIKRTAGARAVSLIPLKPGLTAPVKLRGELMYATTQTDTGAVAYIDPANVLHVPGLTFDGFVGLSPVRECMNAFGLTYAAERFGAQFFGNGARASGVFTYPGQLEEEAYENIQKSLREKMNGENALRPLILEEGLDWKQFTIPPNEAQFLQLRQFQRSEIASLYRVAMHLLQDLQRATNNNIEHQSLDHIRYCLRPWAVRIEQEVDRKLLGGTGSSFKMLHNFNDMQRGDFASQAAAIQVMRGNGIWSANDSLKFLRMNPIPAEQGGDIRVIQGAFVNLTSLLPGADGYAGDAQGTDSDEGDSQPFNRSLRRIGPQFRVLFRDAIGRVVNRNVDLDFTKKVFRPSVMAMAQSVSATRFGSCELTQRELALVDTQVAEIASASSAWDPKDVRAIAARLTEQVYGVFAGEVLE